MLKEEGERAPSLSCEVVTCDDEVKSTQWNFIDGKKSFLCKYKNVMIRLHISINCNFDFHTL